MQLFVRGTETTALDVAGGETVLEIKQRIAQNAGLPVEDQVLIFAGQPLDDGCSLTGYGIGEMSTLTLSIRVLGGKVHGSLARAGKVKGQTPKVEKKEKRKKKTGRAKRRLQYNRRFVAVVPTFGRKKGPNAQNVAI